MSTFEPMDRISIQRLQSGQPRPYADTIHEARIFWEWRGMNDKEDWQPRPIVDAVARERLVPLVRGGVPPEGKGDWASPRLKEFVCESPGLFRILVVTPYTD